MIEVKKDFNMKQFDNNNLSMDNIATLIIFIGAATWLIIGIYSLAIVNTITGFCWVFRKHIRKMIYGNKNT